MRVRAIQRAQHAARERARKAKLSGSGGEEDEGPKNGNDINKKDMTTDHHGKIMQVKAPKADKFPKMIPSTTKSTISSGKSSGKEEIK